MSATSGEGIVAAARRIYLRGSVKRHRRFHIRWGVRSSRVRIHIDGASELLQAHDIFQPLTCGLVEIRRLPCCPLELATVCPGQVALIDEASKNIEGLWVFGWVPENLYFALSTRIKPPLQVTHEV